jgi:hypothetical protein
MMRGVPKLFASIICMTIFEKPPRDVAVQRVAGASVA